MTSAKEWTTQNNLPIYGTISVYIGRQTSTKTRESQIIIMLRSVDGWSQEILASAASMESEVTSPTMINYLIDKYFERVQQNPQ